MGFCYIIVLILAAIVQFLAIGIAGWWAFTRYRNQRLHLPNIEFDIKCNTYGPVQDKYISEFLITFRNKGIVHEEFRSICLRAKGILKDEPLKQWKEFGEEYGRECSTIKEYIKNKEDRKKEMESIGQRLYFPHRLWDGTTMVEIIPRKYSPYYVEPGCKETIRYITTVPAKWSYMLVHVRYDYLQTRMFPGIGNKKEKIRTAERICIVPS